MTRNRFLPTLLLTLLFSSAFSGCFGGDAEPASASAPATTMAATTGPDTNGTTNSSEPVSEEPPVANFTVSVFNSTETNLTSGSDLIFNATNSTDPAGGNLSFAWDFGDNGTGEGVVANHTYETDGNYTVSLNVTSSASNLTTQVSASLTIVAGAPKALEFIDPSGDSTVNHYDLRIIRLVHEEDLFKLRFSLGAMQPEHDTLAVSCFEFFLAGKRFEVDSLDGYGVYDWDGKDAYIAAATVTLASTALIVTIPLEYLEEIKVAAPYTVHLEARGGVCALGGNSNLILDRAPNSGTMTFG